MNPHADAMARSSWRAVPVPSGQLWLAPLIIGVAWWNAALDVWLDFGRVAARRSGDIGDGPPAHRPLEPARDSRWPAR